MVWLQHALLVSGMNSSTAVVLPSTVLPSETINPTPQISTVGPIPMFSSEAIMLSGGVLITSTTTVSVASPLTPSTTAVVASSEVLAPVSTDLAVLSTLAAPTASQAATLSLSLAAAPSSVAPVLLRTSSVAAVSPTPNQPPSVPPEVTISENTIQVTLPSYNLQNFTLGVHEQFRTVTADIINSYCNENTSDCTSLQLRRRRAIATVQPDDVVISNLAENSEGVIQFDLYVLIPSSGGGVLELQALQAAIEANSQAYSSEGFGELLLGPAGGGGPTIAQPTTPPNDFGRETIYVIVVIAILYTIALALCMIATLIAYKKKHSRKKRVRRMKHSDMSAFNVVVNPKDRKSVV